jgi:hypothetical protein
MTRIPSVSFFLHSCWSPLLEDLGTPNKFQDCMVRQGSVLVSETLKSSFMSDWPTALYLEKWLEFY